MTRRSNGSFVCGNLPRCAESFAGPLSAGPLGFAMIGQVVVAGTSISALWTSRDGRVWTEIVSVREAGLDPIVITESAFVGVRTGRNGAMPSIWISTDGSTWTMPPISDDSPVGHDGTSIITPVELGSEILLVQGASLQGAAAGLSPSVWFGTVDSAPDGTVITWQHEDAADALLVGAAVVTATAVPGGFALYGYDSSTLAPLVWTSPDGKTWRRIDLAAGTFGGGFPTSSSAANGQLLLSGRRPSVRTGQRRSQASGARMTGSPGPGSPASSSVRGRRRRPSPVRRPSHAMWTRSWRWT